MLEIRYAVEADRSFWFELDRHLSAEEFELKVRDRRGYVALEDGCPVGLLRCNLFWDNTPFCTMLYVKPECQGRGLGSALVRHWEADMRQKGYGMVMISTQVDESAQHFYRKLGYRDAGGLGFDLPGYEQPMELVMVKRL